MRRAFDLQDAGLPVTVLTIDPAPTADHEEQRAEWSHRGELHPQSQLRNLFDEARIDASWLRTAITGPADRADYDYKDITDSAGTVVLSLPVVTGDASWHMSEAPVIVHDEAGQPIGSVAGFGGLYRAWLSHVVAGDNDVVVIEARQLGELLASWSSPARLIHTIHTIHLEAPYTPDAPINALWDGWFAVADQFDAIAWPTESQAGDVRARFGAGRVDVVAPNGVDIVEAPSSPLPRMHPRAVMVNRLATGKRVDHAIRAWQHVVEVVPAARLDIYGDGPEQKRLAALIAELGLDSSVTLHGHVSDVDICYSAASMLLLTTAYEGQGLVVGEALGTGTPVVSYDVKYGPREALAHGGGVLVPSGDENTLVEAILSLLQDDDYRARLSHEAYVAAAPLSRAVMSQRWAELVREVASRPARRTAAQPR